jgi:hypothetical protein
MIASCHARPGGGLVAVQRRPIGCAAGRGGAGDHAALTDSGQLSRECHHGTGWGDTCYPADMRKYLERIDRNSNLAVEVSWREIRFCATARGVPGIVGLLAALSLLALVI